MYKRTQTRQIKVGNITLGGQDKVLLQSMCNIKTSKVEEVVAQINRCTALGADMMRLSTLDEDDARAFKEIKARTSIPLIADIHFEAKLAIIALEAGVDAVRINPGNIGDEEKIKAVVECARAHHAPIRIGVNSGSLDKSIYHGTEKIEANYLVESARKHVKILEDLGFYDIAISLKGSDAIETIEAYKEAAKVFPYPLHVGITEAGPKDVGLIRSAATLAPILLEGIGDTIRISLSDEPEEEIKAEARLLHDLGMYPNYPTFISCPTCGRTQVSLVKVASTIQKYLEENRINKTVAVMGCIVNGPGEARHSDLGAAGGNGTWVIFKKDKIIKTVKDDKIINSMIEEINKL